MKDVCCVECGKIICSRADGHVIHKIEFICEYCEMAKLLKNVN